MNHDKILRLAKGFRGRAKNCIRIARERVEKALQHSYRDRKEKKREMRGLWIQRINAGTRQYGVSTVALQSPFWSIFRCVIEPVSPQCSSDFVIKLWSSLSVGIAVRETPFGCRCFLGVYVLQCSCS
jgi:hypothetical protein